MKFAFISNYYTHHQKPFCEAMYALTKGDFRFIATEDFSGERKSLGWREEEGVSYVVQKNKAVESCAETVNNADAVILGSAPFSDVLGRLEKGGTVFKYSERIFKGGYSYVKWLPRVLRYYRTYGRHKALYLLSAGAYAAGDFAIHGVFRNKSYKWGYFPETRHYKPESLFGRKNTRRILWCGRLIGWKHPELAINIAKRLADDGEEFCMDIIGSGELEAEIAKRIAAEKLCDRVCLMGAMSSESVRDEMETAGIFIFTSDFNEGWGAVLNEAMNSGCAVVASHAAGSVPYLISQGENGYIYENGNEDALYRRVKQLLNDEEKQRQLGEAAYKTIVELWNGELAAKRLIHLTDEINKKGCFEPYKNGPCSRAETMTNGWYKEVSYDV
ncbi:MAG: glycosyltransferase family 4 protein [Clostridia bacterium]|nr:glycosyltransferase family 4 protein [Clostridia bacterium]